ncbi:uncharacterized protein LOC113794094 [Dermatophagoides pteronyssinus]|uniref:uncharacterized protein LOC113794094 n=1 Tax=Dermatophagoides pteronyssinus TaxID=6956 RepID=UPI003F66A479
MINIYPTCSSFLMILMMVMADNNDRIKLKDIQTLTLYADRLTEARRSSPIKQLTCIGDYCDDLQISTVQCYNSGSLDEHDQSIQWKCEADMPWQYRFGPYDVICENYHSPDDNEFILADSCAMLYTIEKRYHSDHRPGFPDGNSIDIDYDRTKPKPYRRQTSPYMTFIVIVLVIILITIRYYRKLCSNLHHPSNLSSAEQPPPSSSRYRSYLFDNPKFFQKQQQQQLAPPMDYSYPQIKSPANVVESENENHHNIISSLIIGMAAAGYMGYVYGSNQNPELTADDNDEKNNSFTINDTAVDLSNVGVDALFHSSKDIDKIES